MGWGFFKHPIRSTQEFVGRRILRQAIKVIARTPEWVRNKAEIMKFLDNKKEKITGVIVALVTLLPLFGISPDFIQPMKIIGDAIAAGDWQAALGALVTGGGALMRIFYRMKQDRKENGEA